MSNLLPYLLQSTLCLSLFWLMFRIMMRKERFFGLTRMLLLTIVLLSAAIPFIHLPMPIQSPLRVGMLPAFEPAETVGEVISPANSSLTEVSSSDILSAPTAVGSEVRLTIPQMLFYGYMTGCLIALLILLHGLVSVLLLTRKARYIPMEGFRLLVTEREIPAFSFGRWVVLSQSDYDHHRLPMLSHEQAHIRLYHFYDLLLFEIVKIVHWFNPVVYRMAKDLKEIHEFQADDYTLTNGIDATQYQLLIIQKGVGSQRFALANSFNHCQIKKRIAMINQAKTSKAWSWKLATFLPLLALLLMAFGRQSGNVMDHKETQNPVNQKNTEIQSLQNGISREQLSEYENIVNKAKDNNGVPELSKLSDTDKRRLETLFLSMNAEQRAAQIVIFIPVPPLPRSVPTIAQMKIWEDSKTYGLWINDKRVNNSDLKNYTNTDFATFVISKLGKNTVNYGKHYYQVDLVTSEYYANYLAQYELREKYFISIRKKKVEIQSKSANDIEGKANLKALDSIQPKLYVVDGVITDQRRAKYFMEVGVESVTILNGKDATDKYGEKAKNGVFEIALKKEIVKEGNHMATDNIVKGKVTDSSGKPQAVASDIVTGKVTLSDGRPLQRITVRIKGTNTITLTDKDGLFKMADVPKNCMLEFQNVGLKSTTAKPDFENPMNVKMELGSFGIDRVKVICQANDNNPPKPLPKHGFASKMTANPPLFVVDGVILDKIKMDQVEPDDIKSVTVLNAKSATEKYGLLAKNGVMEIQTKGKVNLAAGKGNVVVEVNEYAENQKMELHNNNIIDEMPEFKGGMNGLMKFISGNIKYPDKSQADKTQGNVEVNFVISRDGKVENVRIANAVDSSLDAEAIRVISSMPDWTPGKQSGEPVDVSFTIPIQFSIK